ncbi:MAG: hypothetical protein R3E79_23890 [Caldilineaceae bacterium]
MVVKNRRPLHIYQTEEYSLASQEPRPGDTCPFGDGRATTQLAWNQISTNGGTQMRAELNQDTIADYADTMRRADSYAPFPPITVFYDGESYWLADGFHRHAAAFQAFGPDCLIPIDLHSGVRRDAILHAAGANAKHGLQRKNADKQRAVDTILQDEEWSQWSDNEIARRCAVSVPFVSKRRSLLTINSDATTTRTYRTKHGTIATMQIIRIGKEAASQEPQLPAPQRALTFDETIAVIWRGIQHHAPQTNAERLAWLRTTPVQTFKEMLQPDVMLIDENFINACDIVASELRSNIAHTERAKAHPETVTFRSRTFSQATGPAEETPWGALQRAARLLTLTKDLLTQTAPHVTVHNTTYGATLTAWLEQLNTIIAELESVGTQHTIDHPT